MLKIIETNDKSLAKQVKKELKKNDGYCPSSDLKTKENKCICQEFRNQLHEGPCSCGLYIKIKSNE